MDYTTISFAVLAALAALGVSFAIGYLIGKDKANKMTYKAINSLITDWNKLLKRMTHGDAPKLHAGHEMRGVR